MYYTKRIVVSRVTIGNDLRILIRRNNDMMLMILQCTLLILRIYIYFLRGKKIH